MIADYFIDYLNNSPSVSLISLSAYILLVGGLIFYGIKGAKKDGDKSTKH